MKTFVILYRGINVGGKNPVKMASLRAMHDRLGHEDVKTYIQSGNVVVSAKESATDVAKTTSAAFEEEFGFAASIVVVDAGRWSNIVRDNPFVEFAERAPKTVHIAICEGKPNTNELNALLEKNGDTETFVVAKDVLYLHAPDGLARSKFAAGMERAAGVPMTSRNWRTVEAIAQMIDESN